MAFPGVITPTNFQVSGAAITIGVAVPVTPPVALTAGSPTGGTFIGATLGPANARYRPTPLRIRTQQSTVIVAIVIIEEDFRIEWTLGEITQANMAAMFMGATDHSTYVSIGGLVFPAETTVLAVAQSFGGKYFEAMLYRAVFTEERDVAMQREDTTKPRVVAEGMGIIDGSRSVGDQVGFIAAGITSA